MNCPECGTPVSDEDLFCGECGAILAEPLQATAAQAPPPLDASPIAEPTVSDSRAKVAFILGIISTGSVLINCLPLLGLVACVGPAVGLVAIVLGSIAKRDIRARGGREEDWKRAHQGVILGIVGTVLYLVVMALAIVAGLGMSLLGEW